MLSRGLRLVRYADDFLVLCKTREQARVATELTEAVLGQMELWLDDVDIVHFDQGFRFLGVILYQSTTLVPFDRQKKLRRILYVPPPLYLQAYRKRGSGSWRRFSRSRSLGHNRLESDFHK